MVDKKRKGLDLDEIPQGNNKNRLPRMDELFDMFEFPSRKWTTIRPFGKVFAHGMHWVQTLKADGKTKAAFPTKCLAFDADTATRDSTKHCPWCDFMGTEHNKVPQGVKMPVSMNVSYYVNNVINGLLKNAPERIRPTKTELETGFKDKDSDTWTPFRVIRFPKSLLLDLKTYTALNTHEVEGEEKAFSILHPRYGQTIRVMYDKDREPAKQYTVQAGDALPVNLKKLGWLTYDLSIITEDLDEEELEAITKEADSEFKKWFSRMNFEDDEDAPKARKKRVVDEEEEEDDVPKARKKKPVDLDEEDEDVPQARKKKVVDEEEEEDEVPKARKKKPVDLDEEDDVPKSKKKKPVDLDEEEEDEAPKAKKKKVVDEEDDFDADFDEDETPKSKKKKPVDLDEEDDVPKSKKKKVVDEEEEEDDVPKSKKKKVVDPDEDEEEEEEDEPKAKKKKKVVDDEDDFDLD